jgi:hypothetical protein
VSTYAIDYDGTWTSDPEAFRAFASLLRRRGHTVIIVTSRATGEAEVERECRPYVDGIVLAGRAWKRHAAENAGYKVNVWIDDMPEMIGRAPEIVGQG